MELLIMTVFSVLIFTFLVVIPFFPPLVYFHSRVVCQNQSLFTSGKVCLNLLNTYSGSGSELWCPHISTILQVLVSIQGLVLTENPGLILAKTPFLAQPVVWKPTPLEKSLSQKHNKDYFTKSLLLMEQIIRRPPKNFKDFGVGHFISRAHDIMVAGNAYIEGAQVGCLVQDVDDGDKSSSRQFKNSLAGHINVAAPNFTGIGSMLVQAPEQNITEFYNSLLAERLQALVNEFIRLGAKECEKFLYGITGNVNKRTFSMTT